MKKLRLIILMFTIFSMTNVYFAQEKSRVGTVIKSLSFESKLLEDDVKYSIYLPPGYEESLAEYPVVYLLHGFGDDENGWLDYTSVNLKLDEAINSNFINPIVVIMPDADRNWYINNFTNKYKYGDMFVDEFIPFIDASYKIKSGRKHKGITGLSMGGYGSLVWSMKRPDLFSACAVLSSAVWEKEDIISMPDLNYSKFLGNIYGYNLKGNQRLSDHWINYDPITLARNLPIKSLKSVNWYINCGDDDDFINGSVALNEIFRDRKITHEFRVREGGHQWNYWDEYIIECFQFLDQSFHISKSANDTTRRKQTLRLGVNNWEFWRSTANGQFKGADVDIWNEIAKRNNFQIEYTAIPKLDHLKEAIENDSIDAFVSMRKTPEREEYMSFIEPPFRTKLKILTYVKSESNLEITKLEDMHELKVALIGGNYDNIENDSLIEKNISSWNASKGFNGLANNSLDVVHVNQWLAKWFLRNGEYNSQIKLTPYSYNEYHPCYMVMSKKSALSPKWEKKFGQTIQEMIDDGTMKRIIDSYIPEWYESYPPE